MDEYVCDFGSAFEGGELVACASELNALGLLDEAYGIEPAGGV